MREDVRGETLEVGEVSTDQDRGSGIQEGLGGRILIRDWVPHLVVSQRVRPLGGATGTPRVVPTRERDELRNQKEKSNGSLYLGALRRSAQAAGPSIQHEVKEGERRGKANNEEGPGIWEAKVLLFSGRSRPAVSTFT